MAASESSFLFSVFTGGEQERVSFFSFFVLGGGSGARKPGSNFSFQLDIASVVGRY